MSKRLWVILSSALLAVVFAAVSDGVTRDDGFVEGNPGIRSMSTLAVGPDGVLFIGDSKGAAVYAVDLGDDKPAGKNAKVEVKDVERKIAALLGTKSSEVMIHDMVVNPISQNVYLAVSRGRGKWDSAWMLPNDLADATVLLRIDPSGKIDAVELKQARYAKLPLPNAVDEKKTHMWKEGIALRADAITDLAYSAGTLYIAGLSNEEFASTMWRVSYPFQGDPSATTLEIFHGAHGEFETHAPIRTFVPYDLNDKPHLLAAYLCTPFVTFEVADLEDGQHVKGRTVAEFGSGNYPLDMVVYRKGDKDRILIANSNLPFMIVDPGDVESFKGSIAEEVEGYVAGVTYEPRSGTGIQQMDVLNEEFILALRRLPGGTMDMVSLSVRRF